MATTIARLEALLTADTKAFDRAMDKSHKNLGGVAKAAGVAGAALSGALFLGARAGFNELMQAQKVGAQTEAVLKATGNSAHVSAKQIQELSVALLHKTGVDDEVIQQAANTLLSFKNIRNEVGQDNKIFDRAVGSLLDLGRSLKGAGLEGASLQAIALRLGSALSDAAKAMTSLSRSGIQFTATQKEQIKALVGTGVTAKQAAANIASATEKIKAAQEAQKTAAVGVASAQDSRTSANEQLVRSQQAVVDSTVRVKDAKNTLRDAQERAKETQQGLTEARKRAADQLRDLWDASVDAALAEKSATLSLAQSKEDLIKAQQEYSKVFGDTASTDEERRQAPLNLKRAYLGVEQAEQSLKESHKSRARAFQDSEKAAKKGVEGSDELTNARKAQREANEDVVKAEQGVARALRDVKDAQKGVNASQRGVAAAQRQMAAATAV